jgi:hypothetical protein
MHRGGDFISKIFEAITLLEQQRSQFSTLGDGLQLLNDKMDRHILENQQGHQQTTSRIDHLILENHQDHQHMKQMIRAPFCPPRAEPLG